MCVHMCLLHALLLTKRNRLTQAAQAGAARSRPPRSPSNSARASEASGSAVSNGQAMSAALSIARSQVSF